MAKSNSTNTRSTQKNTVDSSIRKKVESYLDHLREQGLSIQSAFLFGSQVTARSHQWSDIDVCVVSLDFGPHKDALSFLWRALRKQDVKAGIEPIGFHPDDFVDDLPLVHEILRYGIRII